MVYVERNIIQHINIAIYILYIVHEAIRKRLQKVYVSQICRKIFNKLEISVCPTLPTRKIHIVGILCIGNGSHNRQLCKYPL